MDTRRVIKSALTAINFSMLAGFAAVVTGAVVLAGWAFDIAAMKSIQPGWVSMKANTAVGFVLIGIALILTAPASEIFSHHFVIRTRLARLCSVLAGLTGLLSLVEYISGWNIGIDQWLFAEPVDAVGTSNPGRMAPETALCFVLLAVWVVGNTRKNLWTTLASVIAGLVVVALALAAMQSYFTPDLGPYGWFGLTIMAMHTAILFAMLGMAVIATSWRSGALSWSLSLRTTLAFAFGLVLLVFIGLDTSRSQFWLKQTNSQIAYREETLADIRGLLIEVIDAQAHLRGYIITDNDYLRNDYLNAKANCRVKLEALRKVMLGHPDQQQAFTQINASVNGTLLWFQQVIDARKNGMTIAARNRTIVNGEVLLNNLRNTFDQIEIEHLEQIRLLKLQSKNALQLSYFTLFSGTLASLFVFLVAIFRLNFAVSERERKEYALQESEERFRNLTESAQDAIIMMGIDQRISFWNGAAGRIFGYSAAEAMGRVLHELIAPVAASAKFSQAFPDFQRNGAGAFIGKVTELVALRKGGEEFPVELSVSAARLGGQWLAISIVRDITERRAHEAKILRMNQLYNFLNQCNQAIVRSDNQEALFLKICRNAVQLGDMKMAWIGLVDDVSRRIVSVASYGEGVDYLDGRQISVDAEDSIAQDSVSLVIRKKQPYWCQDLMQDRLTRHEPGVRFGWAGKASLPLYRNGIVIGCFTLYSGQVNAFDEDVRSLLVEVSNDIGYALDHFAIEAKRKAAELRLLESEMQYRNLADSGQALIWASGTDRICNYFNQPWLKFTGQTFEQALGDGWAGAVHPDDIAQCKASFASAFDLLESFSRVYRLRRGNGEYAWIQDDSCPRYNAEGAFIGYIGYCLDITEHKEDEKRLRLFRTLLDSSSDAIEVLDPVTLLLLDVNETECRMLGYSREEMLSMSIIDIDPALDPKLKSEVQSRFRQSGHALFETLHRRKDGTTFHVEVSLKLVALDKPYALSIVRDITERKQAENSLRKLSLAVEQSSNTIVITDLDANIEYVNQTFVNTTGYSLSEVAGQNPRLLHSGKTPKAIYADMWEHLIRGESWKGEFINRRKDGTEYVELVWISPVRESDGRVTNYLAIKEDITALRGMSQMLGEKEAYLHTLVGSIPDLIWAKDQQGVYLGCNPMFERFFGASEADIIGKTDYDFVDKELADAFREHDNHVMATEKASVNEEWIHFADDGHQALLETIKTPMRDADGKLKGVLGIARDITERKRIEAEIIQLNAELEKKVIARTVDLEHAKQEAEQANQAKSAFLATMSHEIRTPMNGVIGMLEVLQQSSLNARQMEMTNLIHDSAFSLLSIINDILDFSRIEANKLQIDNLSMSVATVVEGACESLDRMALKNGSELILFTDPDIPEAVIGDAGRLRQILLNLINNAIKFSSGQDRSGRVSVRALLVERTIERVTLEFYVTDNGVGMDKGTISRLFTAFTQADSSTTRIYGGTGLGLAISRQLTHLMGGEISVQSVPGEGSLFTVQLPFALPAEQPASEASWVAGLNCMVVGAAQTLADDLATYLLHDGAHVERVNDQAVAQQMIARQREDSLCIVVIDAAGNKLSLDKLRTAAGKHPEQQTCFVVVERGMRRQGRIEASDLVVLDADGMGRHKFLEAVAIAAGRVKAAEKKVFPADVKVIARPLSRDEARRQGRLILIAEDNEINQKVILQQLVLLGRTADIANNGREALQRWRSGDYALLFADLHMPEMDGYELTAAIRAAEAAAGKSGRARTPVIAFTANALKGEAERCHAVGMDDYLSKPVQLVVLDKMLEKWLPLSASGPALATPPDAIDVGEVVDVNVLRSLVGDDEASISEFLHDFHRGATQIAVELRTACAQGQPTVAGKLAHKLKSSALTVGARALGELCAEIETLGRAGEMDALAALMPAFEKALASVEKYLDEIEMRSARTVT
jgi:PAS domain S-box-containing protein